MSKRTSRVPVPFPSEPEPDIVVVRGEVDDYVDRHPGPEEIPLVIEIADATLRRDRGIKLRMYARAGIAIYWIVDLAGGSIEVYTNPDSQATKPTCGKPRVYRENSKIPIELAGRKIGTIAVVDILP